MQTLWKLYTGFTLVLILAGCHTTTPTPAPAVTGAEQYVSAVLRTDYEGALTVRNQLALGIMRLDETPHPLTEEEAADLLPLWQAMRGTMNSGAAAIAEVDALLAQIEGTLTPEQLQAIADMRLTTDDLRAWAEQEGLTLPGEGMGSGAGAGGGPGAGVPGGGPGRALSDEERAARQAQGGGPGKGSGLSIALLDRVIAYLESQAG